MVDATKVLSRLHIRRSIRAGVALVGVVVFIGVLAPASAQNASCNGKTVTIFAVVGVPTNGTPQADVIMGTSGDDEINGRQGNDTICGLGGRDTIRGAAGADWIDGGADGDRIFGGPGNDTLRGAAGWDRLNGASGRDTMNGGLGQDTMYGGGWADAMDGGTGADFLFGGPANDTLRGGAGSDELRGSGGSGDRCIDPDSNTISGGCESTEGFTPTSPPATSPPANEPDQADFFVSRNGTNGDGRSWASAWNELDQIDWSSVGPGDVIAIDGGSSAMTYRTRLEPQQSGTTSAPITIRLSTAANRNGQAKFFGGRSTLLPHCGQLAYTYETDGVRSTGVDFDEVSHIVLDGTKWSGIEILGHNGRGIFLDDSVRNITMRNIEVFDNGIASKNSEGEWRPNRSGIALGGANITFDRMLIHDNGQDAIQSISGDNKIANLMISNSWLYNEREHPTRDESFNYCRHSDGLQIYDGGTVSGITINNSIIGPGFTQGVILGQTDNGVGSSVVVNNVTITDTIFAKGKGLNISGYPDLGSQNWTLDRVTSHCISEYTGVCMWLEGSGHQIRNSIFVGAQFVVPDGIAITTNNCQFDIDGFDIGTDTDPKFVSTTNDPFTLDNYALQSSSPCSGKGSNLTSVQDLLSRKEGE